MTELSPRQKGLVFFGLTILLSLLVAVWVLYINKGTLSINSNPPFYVDFNGAPDKNCDQSPCVISLFPGNYPVSLQKDGFLNEFETVTIKRWQNLKLDIAFKPIPTITKITDWQEPKPPAGLINNLSEINFFPATKIAFPLKDLPADTKSLLFSPSASFAIGQTLDQLFVYDMSKNAIKNLSIKNPVSFVWSKDDNAFIYLTTKADKKYQELWRFKISNASFELITSFPRPINKAKLVMSPTNNKLALIDQTENSRSVYLLDLNEKWKKRLFFDEELIDINFSPADSYLLIEKRPDRSRISELGVFNLKEQTFSSLTIKTGLNRSVFVNDDTIIFVTNQVLPEDGQFTGSLFESLQQKLLPRDRSDQFLFYNLKTAQYQKIFIPSSTDIVYHADRLALDREKNLLYFQDNQNLYSFALSLN